MEHRDAWQPVRDGPEHLQQLDTSILPDDACGGGTYYLCINNVDGWRGACYGDSGGPAVIRTGTEWALVGATSGGTGKCGENPSFYTDLVHLRSWIESHAGTDAGGTPNPPAATNLALNRAATSSHASCAASEAPAKAVNGSTGGGLSDKWCANGQGAKSLEVDLGTVRPLSKLVVKHAAAGGESAGYNTRTFAVEVAAADGKWRSAASVAGNTAAVTTHPVTGEARRIRLTTTDPIARIYEFEAY